MTNEDFMQLSERERSFASFFVDTGDEFKSAVLARYEDVTREKAKAILEDKSIQQAIAYIFHQRGPLYRIDRESLLKEMAIIAYSDVRSFAVNHETGRLEAAPGVPGYAFRAISSIKTKVTMKPEGEQTVECEYKFWNKPAMIEKLFEIVDASESESKNKEVEGQLKVFIDDIIKVRKQIESERTIEGK